MWADLRSQPDEYLYVLQDPLPQRIDALDVFRCWLDVVHSVANALLRSLREKVCSASWTAAATSTTSSVDPIVGIGS